MTDGRNTVMREEWNGFCGGNWEDEINVRDFIQANYRPYSGDASFLSAPTERTNKVWERCTELLAEENKKGGVLDVDTEVVSTTTSHGPGYIDKENRLEQKSFKCLKCGYTTNADFNAARNISIQNIDKIIEEQLKLSE